MRRARRVLKGKNIDDDEDYDVDKPDPEVGKQVVESKRKTQMDKYLEGMAYSKKGGNSNKKPKKGKRAGSESSSDFNDFSDDEEDSDLDDLESEDDVPKKKGGANKNTVIVP